MALHRQICKTPPQFTKVLHRLSTEKEEYDTDLRQRDRQHHEAFSRHANDTEEQGTGWHN